MPLSMFLSFFTCPAPSCLQFKNTKLLFFLHLSSISASISKVMCRPPSTTKTDRNTVKTVILESLLTYFHI